MLIFQRSGSSPEPISLFLNYFLAFLIITAGTVCIGQTVHIDTPFLQETHKGFAIGEYNPDANDVRRIISDQNENIWIATKNGVYKKKNGYDHWELITRDQFQGPAYDLCMDDSGTLWMASWCGLLSLRQDEIRHHPQIEGPVGRIWVQQDTVMAFGPKGFWMIHHSMNHRLDINLATSVRNIASDLNGRGLWVSTDVGLYWVLKEKAIKIDPNLLLSAYTKSTEYDPSGSLWVGGLGGITILKDGIKTGTILPDQGLPHAEVTCIRRNPADQTMWIGTKYGISRFKNHQSGYSVLLGRRWLMGNEVRDITFDSSGDAWIATNQGVSKIERQQITLEEKADYFYDRLIKRHIRAPWIAARNHLKVSGDTTSYRSDDDDNDGEYTSNYLAMESFRYAVTGDTLSKIRAQKAFHFLKLLQEVTGTSGFFARTIIPVEWETMHDPNTIFSEKEKAEILIRDPRRKFVPERWRISVDGKWRWKGDTSSDEICGHMFGYFFYYELVADPREKAIVRNHVANILDHLMENDFNLVDLDGHHTRWGVWSPQKLNGDPNWQPEKALNSLELLSFLKFGYYITGLQKYEDAYLNLIKEHNYLDNAEKIKDPDPAFQTYFDIYLAAYLFPALLKEQNPEFKKIYLRHLDQWFTANKVHKSPMVNFLFNYLKGNDIELKASVDFLQKTPLDLVDWPINNGLREDLPMKRFPILEDWQVPLRPANEIRTIRWDKNPYSAVVGNPHEEFEPVFWLLPYWLARYCGLIK
ncbi:hypothetical protein [Membranihabitans maritimus]|uniref:hypothetical protein n=1 Tax=Membranihabitans maritimus TaxID=2904244 RepID=UPI001F34B1B8|nr:hypothetical protein [Membranihabitans maritimus]